MSMFSPNLCHDRMYKNQKPLLAYDPAADYGEWKAAVRDKFTALLGADPEHVEPNLRIVWERETDTYTERRMVFDAEPETSVPCHLLVPKAGKAPYPLVICLQGHTGGMHISLGRALYPQDPEKLATAESDFALQIINEGYAALCIEQRGFGERKCEPERYDVGNTTCMFPAMNAMLMGRTLIRERAWDVSRAIDAVAEFPEIDTGRIGLMGNSGGGTASYYTACLEPRIKAVMPSCSVCAFDMSIAMRRHCACNYIPGMAKYMDMGEMACMIAPRPLLVVAGERDTGFRIEGVKRVYSVIEQIYEKEGAPENCQLLIGPDGHKFYPSIAWAPFRERFMR